MNKTSIFLFIAWLVMTITTFILAFETKKARQELQELRAMHIELLAECMDCQLYKLERESLVGRVYPCTIEGKDYLCIGEGTEIENVLEESDEE